MRPLRATSELLAVTLVAALTGCGAQAVPAPGDEGDAGDDADGVDASATDSNVTGEPGETDVLPPPDLCRQWRDWDCGGGSFDVSAGGSCTATCAEGSGYLVGSCDPTGLCFCACDVSGVEMSQAGIRMTPTTASRVRCCDILPDFLNLGCCP